MAFLVAGAVFLAVVGAILLAGRDAVSDGTDAAAERSSAGSLVQILVDSPGVGWAGGPEAVTRLGLAATNGSGLQDSSLEALRGATPGADGVNGKVDYEEARASLGLTEGEQFHVRMYPVGLPSAYRSGLGGLRTGFIGDWVNLATVTVALAPSDEMLASAQAGLDTAMFSLTAEERQALVDLGVDFDDRVFLSTASPTILVSIPLLPDPPLLEQLNLPLVEGDVYPDDKTYLRLNLPGRIGLYDVLVVGSEVDHASLTDAATKEAIRDWVLAGGILLVFGSDAQNTQWLQPLFQVGVQTVNGGAFAPDPSHPMLREPNALDWTAYDSHGQGWDIKSQGSGAHYDDFSHVIVEDGLDLLAVSGDGTFGDGRVLLSTYRPREIAMAQGLTEAENLMANLLLYADRSHLYLEYGPTIPPDMEVTAAVRESHVWDPLFGQVVVVVELHLWQGS